MIIRRCCGAVAVGTGLFASVQLSGCAGSTNTNSAMVTPNPRLSTKPVTTEQTRVRDQLTKNGLAPSEADFAFHLMQKVSAQQPSGNVFLSPFSVSQAVLLAANGTTGTTQTSFLKAIGLPTGDIKTVNTQKKELLALLEPPMLKGDDDKESPAYEWTVANAVWSRVPPKPDYVATCQNALGAIAEPLTTAAIINSWAKDKTGGRISQLVTDEDVQNAELILTNAVYFKGQWVKPFVASATKDTPFHLPDGKTRNQPLMYDTSQGRSWYKGKNYEAVLLDYKGNLSMVIILPAANTTPQKIIANLDAKEWNAMHSGMKPSWIALAVPKFEIEYKTSLLKPLKELGMPTSGNFTPIADQLAQTSISEVVQKTFLRVDERGTEAAAATAVMMPRSAARPPEGKPHPFIVDRPFVCALVHDTTGTLLFSGIINDPTPAK